ncbi:ADP-ribose glycohydrolase OARD1-like [Belonocnema kinseyi]|uniref:ADP-ribose glycohydrolase OARD1-like n=1 Tax=Belonocnema kinseyi TaxID=2817044 RepID=UPI00143CDEBB|nr:ADP-ribose glycohydrolase OARD1-like [Belonocnema kinseyi]
MGKDNFVHVIASDCILSTTIGRTLIDLGYVDPERLRESNPKKGQIVVSKVGSTEIFSVMTRENHFEPTTPENLYYSLLGLREALRQVDTKTVRISGAGDGLDKLPANILRNIIRQIFVGSDVTFTLCSGEV